jgi:hypothetical protein
MFRTLRTYLHQRFGPAHLALGAFLVLFANGTRWTIGGGVFAYLYMLALLFWFRLFDDLASSEVDRDKPDRVYTEPHAHRILRRLLVVSGVVLAVATTAYDPRSGTILVVAMVVSVALYRALFARGRWRFVLPLLKYPALALVLVSLVGEISLERALACAALLPVFVLFESIDDPALALSRPVAIALVIGAHLLLAPSTAAPIAPVAVGGVALVALSGSFVMLRRAPYLLMLYFLLLRLTTLIDV